MNINLKDIKLFSTEEEREQERQRKLNLSSDYGSPEHELSGMYNATVVGKYFFQALTLASTTSFIYRVSFSHVAEIAGEFVASAFCAIIAIGCSLAVEKMLEGNMVPFFKKLFVKGELDVVLMTLALIFSSIVIGGAYQGMQVVAEDTAQEVQTESVMDVASSTHSSIEAKDAEIAKIQACKIKKVGYCWQSNITPKGHARIEQLQREKEQLLSSLESVSNTTNNSNSVKISTADSKLKKAQKYLGTLALAAEGIKIIIFIFWGYFSQQMNIDKKKRGEFSMGKSSPTPLPKESMNHGQVGEEEAMDDPYLDMWATCRNNRRSYTTEFKNVELGRSNKPIEKLIEMWNKNEEKMEYACNELNRSYYYNSPPTQRKTNNYQ